MKKFELLIIGDSDHQYIILFVKWLRTIFPNINVSIISTNPDSKCIYDKKIYDQGFLAIKNSNIFSRIKGLRSFYRAYSVYKLIKTNNLGSDSILVHYIMPWLSLISTKLKHCTKNFSITFWGSDFYRLGNKFLLIHILKNVDNIIIATPQMILDFKKIFPQFNEKVHLCFFGNEPLEFLKSNVSKKDSCDIFNITNNKLNVTIGHNGSQAHQHLAIIDELKRVDKRILKLIRIIFPMTYGLDIEYLQKIKKACIDLEVEIKILTDFMNENEVAHLRNLTDIMINLQITDAFSGTMKEVLYCGGVVINGNWLPYQFLKEMDVYFVEVSSIPELSIKLSDIVVNYSFYKDLCKNNSLRIYNLSNWSQTIHNWKEVIKLQR